MQQAVSLVFNLDCLFISLSTREPLSALNSVAWIAQIVCNAVAKEKEAAELQDSVMSLLPIAVGRDDVEATLKRMHTKVCMADDISFLAATSAGAPWRYGEGCCFSLALTFCFARGGNPLGLTLRAKNQWRRSHAARSFSLKHTAAASTCLCRSTECSSLSFGGVWASILCPLRSSRRLRPRLPRWRARTLRRLRGRGRRRLWASAQARTLAPPPSPPTVRLRRKSPSHCPVHLQIAAFPLRSSDSKQCVGVG